MRLCRPGTVPKPKPPMRNSAIAAAIPDAARVANATSTTSSAVTKNSRVRSIERSARRPPTTLPMTRPTPNRTSSQGTDSAAKPLTSVRV